MTIADDSEARRLEATIEAARLASGRRYAIYTSVLNGYSKVLPPPQSLRAMADFFLIADSFQDAPGWQQLIVPQPTIDPRRAAKRYKLLPQLILQGYELSLWVDGNMELCGAVEELFSDFSVSENAICVFNHRARDCVYAEARECRRWNKDDPAKLDEQVARYKAAGHPENAGLYMGGFLLRRHNDPACQNAMQLWWDELEKGSVRDQLALPVVLRRTGVAVITMPFVETGKYFLIHSHRKFRSYQKGLIPNPRALFALMVYRLSIIRARISKLRKQA